VMAWNCIRPWHTKMHTSQQNGPKNGSGATSRPSARDLRRKPDQENHFRIQSTLDSLYPRLQSGAGSESAGRQGRHWHRSKL
jgi:hypothetical protein